MLTDVDDTMYANLVDKRYALAPNEDGAKPLYPGVLAFYDAIQHEPFEWESALDQVTGGRKVPLTTLSARPNPFVGGLEKASIEKLAGLPSPPGARLKLMPSALSGAIVSSTLGTIESIVNARIQRRLNPGQPILTLLHDELPRDQEEKIGEVKFRNFQEYAQVYPEYRYVFVGDSGQADALTAKSLVTDTSAPGTSRVVTTFIHALKADDNVTKLQSRAFRALGPEVTVDEKSASGRGVIVFRNYIDAAVIAYAKRETLRDPVTKEELITASELAAIAECALADFAAQTAGIAPNALPLLREEYKKDAERAAVLLATDPAQSEAAERIRAASSKL